ncbi:hypothetical protein XBKB1_1200040 [Xenorhabdus bovienii str. kraussei Becker Underwood]|uniref:Uncharacterized protein n=1 Tax=Xenorhabdus bovienii str. kraussei Becker Underwood TaxID=1398204 RepID=A0A077PN61_XENBV|nr:hypothetical protein XBKB1_1200040 [Xenorhabdus bovienii str. kraussei Becker Underwood]
MKYPPLISANKTNRIKKQRENWEIQGSEIVKNTKEKLVAGAGFEPTTFGL